MTKIKDYLDFYYEKIAVNLSSTFMTKSRCKKCGSLPCAYFYVRNRILYKDFHDEINIKNRFLNKYCKRMCGDYYMKISPKYFNNLKSFSVSTAFKGYSSKLHHSRGKNSFINNITEFLMCECGETAWAYNDRSIRMSPEIFNRKSRSKYDKKFEY